MVSYKPLDLERGEVRLLTLHPGEFADPIRISLRHAHLPIPAAPLEDDRKVDLEKLRQTTPAGWEVHQTFEGRVIFWNEAEKKSSWSHPDPAAGYVSKIPRQARKLQPEQPEFEALSYTWGGPSHGTAAEHVWIEESDDFPDRAHQDPSKLMPVTDNLAAALRHLRSSTATRTFWIDAVCINQDDLIERGRHVARMGNVYSLATRVVAWLGPETRDSSLALEALEHLGKQIEMKGTGSIPSPICDHPEWIHNFPCDKATLGALRDLLHRRWFQRLWIWQEIVLANIDAYVQCGHKTVSWYYLRRGLVMLRETNLPHTEMRMGLIPYPLLWLPYIFEAEYRVWHGISGLLHSASQSGCADPRDRIYGLLGMCESELAAQVRPDYTLPHPQVYRNFFTHFVEHYKSLLLLQYCDLERRTMDGPTWVPDWNNNPIRPWQLVYAAGLSRAQVAFDHDMGVMSALGVRAAEVTAVSERRWLDRPESVQQVFNMLKNWYAIWRQHSPQGSPLGDFITPLRYGWTHERRHVGVSVASLMADWLDLTGGDDKEPSAEELGRSELLQSVIRDERTCAFFCTDKGQAGLGPVGTKRGDIIAVILGSDHAMVLRPQGDQAKEGESFHVVGPAYVHGIMDAQYLIGEFHQPHALEIKCGTANGNIWTTFNTQTGESDIEDARLGPLPSGWSLENRGFRNEKGAITEDDPRWSVESLRQRGVKLEEFRLV